LPDDEPDYGDPEEVKRELEPFVSLCDTEEAPHAHHSPQEKRDREAVTLAVTQSAHFDSSRVGVGSLIEVNYPHRPSNWQKSYHSPDEFLPNESIMGSAILAARLAFEDNQRAKETRGLKTGRIDRRLVGKRAPFEDPRMFYRKNRPGKKDYFFAIGVDISGSTGSYGRGPRILRAVFAQATLLNRLGHKFAIYGMTGGRNLNDLRDPEYHLLNDVWIFNVKGPNEPWSASVQQRLADLQPCNENFDGHNMEYLRKVLDGRTETSRGIIYYTDGAMPARNYEEELMILTNELQTCKKKKYAVMAVGINTDSPRQYGLNTVQVDSDKDVIKVTKQLGEYLTQW